MKNIVLKLLPIHFIVALLLFSCKKEEKKQEIERDLLIDVQGNIYETVKIGNQWWMAENLRCTVFNDSTPIDYIERTDGADTLWSRNENPAYTYIATTSAEMLYNGFVLFADKEIAPEGWHVATDEDWKTLEKEIGMSDSETSALGWRGEDEANLITKLYNIGWPANDHDNELFGLDKFGFSATPTGCRGYDGRTNIQNNTSFWWAKTNNPSEISYRYIDIHQKRIFRQMVQPGYAMAIRCVKD